jgi:hypothetical protein
MVNKVLGVFISILQVLKLHIEDTIFGSVAENVPKKSPDPGMIVKLHRLD